MAQVDPVGDVISGNFAGDGRDEVFFYSSEPGEDLLVSFTNGGIPGGEARLITHPFAIEGAYWPVAGDFDGDQWDEILWYAPGPAQDLIWDFTSWTAQTSRNVTINGDYWPLVGDYSGDGVEDIFWYAPGTAPDTIFDFNPGGGYTTARRNVNGDYFPLVASIGKDATDDILWYAPGPAADTLFDFTWGGLNYTTKPTPANGVYDYAFTLDIFGDGWRGDDVWWYRAVGADPIWDYWFPDGFNQTRRTVTNSTEIAGHPVVGDYFNDNGEDVLWLQDGQMTLWDHHPHEGDVHIYGYVWQLGGATAFETPSGQGTRVAVPDDLPTGSVEASDSQVLTR